MTSLRCTCRPPPCSRGQVEQRKGTANARRASASGSAIRHQPLDRDLDTLERSVGFARAGELSQPVTARSSRRHRWCGPSRSACRIREGGARLGGLREQTFHHLFRVLVNLSPEHCMARWPIGRSMLPSWPCDVEYRPAVRLASLNREGPVGAERRGVAGLVAALGWNGPAVRMSRADADLDAVGAEFGVSCPYGRSSFQAGRGKAEPPTRGAGRRGA